MEIEWVALVVVCILVFVDLIVHFNYGKHEYSRGLAEGAALYHTMIVSQAKEVMDLKKKEEKKDDNSKE